MNNPVTERLAESLRHQAGRIVPGPSLADAAQGQARQIRLHRRVTAGAACLVALAIAIPFGFTAFDSGNPRKTEIAPAESPKPTPAPPPNDDPVTVYFDLEDLPKGDAPKVPWYSASDAAIHDRDQETPISDLRLTLNGEPRRIGALGTAPVVSFSPTPDGYLVMVSCCEGIGLGDTRVWLLDTAGQVKRELGSNGPAISPDGQTIAAVGYEDDRYERGYLYTIDAETGDELSRSKVTQGAGPSPVGFLGDQVLFSDSPVAPEWRALWDPEADTIDRVEGNPKPDPPNGRHLVVRSTNSDEVHAIVDASDGRKLLELRGPTSVEQPVEEGDNLLFVASTENRQAKVRCTLDGECERAGDVVEGGPGAPALSLPSRDGWIG